MTQDAAAAQAAFDAETGRRAQQQKISINSTEGASNGASGMKVENQQESKHAGNTQRGSGEYAASKRGTSSKQMGNKQQASGEQATGCK
jgi:hypothetical protein